MNLVGICSGVARSFRSVQKKSFRAGEQTGGIVPSLFPRRPLTIGDDSERLMADRAATVSVSRGERPGLSRTASRARLAYRDPMAESTFAALVALLAGRSEPVAADPETLSVLAMADRLARTDIPVLINGPTGTARKCSASSSTSAASARTRRSSRSTARRSPRR
jgi:hypothetical protein